jgi:formylglycine-generating enzyme
VNAQPERSPRLAAVIAALAMALQAMPSAASVAQYVSIPAATFRSVLPPDGKSAPAVTAAFQMRSLPVTNDEFQSFVRRNPSWQRGLTPALFADAGYLRKWAAADAYGANLLGRQAVTNVSWFAADAFCRDEGARLPTWHEWELVAAADESRKDARDDPRWRERLLGWYSRPSNDAQMAVGKTPKNAYGVYDLHGLVWEWVDDFTSVMVSTDSREQGDPDLLKFCGAGAIAVGDRDNYAVLMHLALLSSLKAAYTTSNLGFRCAKSLKVAQSNGRIR